MRESKSGRKIRRCAEKFYDEDLGLNINTHNITTFDLFEKVTSDVFDNNDGAIEDLDADDVTLQNILRRGFYNPFIVRAESGKPPGLRVPETTFSAKDVERLVGSTRKVDVMDVSTQRSLQMTMHQWAKYFESDKRDTLLNVISLEVSKTALCQLVSPPNFVREIDWVETVWPHSLKNSQAIGTNDLSKMKYPKVQKYCLMSVRGSYTDFHVDFGGTSVWYHIVAGAKVFWLIPPTEENLSKFVKWTLAGKQSDVFFGDLVDRCYRVHLFAGDTFYLPGGWIHGVYTPRKSLVFGGNFLHSYNIVGQLKVTAIEDITKVEPRYLYPYFVEMSWFVVEKYHKYLKYAEDHGKGNSVLMVEEVEGLNLLISRLEDSPMFQASIPAQIKDPKTLLREVRDLLLHAEIDQECCDFSEPLLLRGKNLSVETSGKNYARLVTSNRPFQVSPVPFNSDSESSEDDDEEDVDVDVEDCEDGEDDILGSEEDNNEEVKSEAEDDVPALESVVSKTEIKSLLSPESPRKRRKLTPTALNSYLSTFYCPPDDSSSPPSPPPFSSPSYIPSSSAGTRLYPHSSLGSSSSAKSTIKPAKTCRKKNRDSAGQSTRRRRCGTCQGCARSNCGRCKFCLDMRSFGGPNVRRQSCVERRCEKIGNNHQTLFQDAGVKICSACSISTSDWKNNPMLTCWNCDKIVHWACQEDKTLGSDKKTLGSENKTCAPDPPTDQELAVLWRWKCGECYNNAGNKIASHHKTSQSDAEARYGKPLSLEVPHKNVAVPVTLAVPFTDITIDRSRSNGASESSVGNIFTKLASQPRLLEPKTPNYPASNIFNKFQPKVVLTDKKPEVLKQAKHLLESKALISPSKLLSLTCQPTNITSSVMTSHGSVMSSSSGDVMSSSSGHVTSSSSGHVIPSSIHVTSSTSHLSVSSGQVTRHLQFDNNCLDSSCSSTDLVPYSNSCSTPRIISDVGESGPSLNARSYSMPILVSSCSPKNNSENKESESSQSSDFVKKIQPVITLTRRPSVLKPRKINRKFRKLSDILQQKTVIVPHSEELVSVTQPAFQCYSKFYCDSSPCISISAKTKRAMKITRYHGPSKLNYDCPALRDIFKKKDNLSSSPGISCHPHFLNSCHIPTFQDATLQDATLQDATLKDATLQDSTPQYATPIIFSPTPIVSPLVHATHVVPITRDTFSTDTSTNLDRVLSNTRDVLAECYRSATILEFQARQCDGLDSGITESGITDWRVHATLSINGDWSSETIGISGGNGPIYARSEPGNHTCVNTDLVYSGDLGVDKIWRKYSMRKIRKKRPFFVPF